MPRKKKALMGRPIEGEEGKQRYQVTLEPRIAKILEDLGGGNRSLGIEMAARAAQGLPPPKEPEIDPRYILELERDRSRLEYFLMLTSRARIDAAIQGHVQEALEKETPARGGGSR